MQARIEEKKILMTIFLPVLNGLEVLVFMHDLSRFGVCPLEFVEINWTANTHSAFLREVFFFSERTREPPKLFSLQTCCDWSLDTT